MGSKCELLINVVTIEVPKLLAGTKWLVVPLKVRNTSPRGPPAKRQTLSQSCDMQGTWKPHITALRAGEPQGTLMVIWE